MSDYALYTFYYFLLLVSVIYAKMFKYLYFVTSIIVVGKIDNSRLTIIFMFFIHIKWTNFNDGFHILSYFDDIINM